MITFFKSITKENGEYVEVYYCSLNSIDDEAKERRTLDLFNKFFTRIKSHKDMARNVRILRGIFRDYNEGRLEIAYNDGKRSEKVWFKGGELSQFKVSKLIEGEWKDVIFLNCEPGEIEEFTIEPPGWEKIDYSKLQPIDPDIGSDLEEYEETAELYKLFYGETLDFTDPNANVRIQAMALILNHYHIHGGCCWYAEHIVPQEAGSLYSWRLRDEIAEAFSLGELELPKESNYSEEDQKKVATIGEVIRASIKDTPDKEAALTQIARILWIANQKGHSIDGIYFTPEEDEYNVGQIIADCDSIKRWDCPGADVRATVKTFQNISRKLYGE